MILVFTLMEFVKHVKMEILLEMMKMVMEYVMVMLYEFYSLLATDSDESCIYPFQDGYDCDGNCLSDSDGDGICDYFEIPDGF